MGRYFSIAELCVSDTAKARGVDNTPPPQVAVKLTTLIGKLLDPVREAWGKPIRVNSGFRSPVLNRIVGGKPNSQHLMGEAVDITAGSPAANKRLFALIKNGGFEFDQLIDERNLTWIHVSYRAGKNRKQVLYL